MLNTILNAMRVSHPVTETVNRSDDQHTVSIEMGNAGNTHRLPSADRHHASSFVRGFLTVSEWVKGLLSPVNQRSALTPSKMMADVRQYFNNSIAVSSDVSERLINNLLVADSVSADAAFDTLASVAKSYFTGSDTIISDDVTKVLMKAFLRLKDKNSSETFKKSIGDLLWDIYLDVNDNKNLSLSAQQVMIDANLVFDQWHEKSDIFSLIKIAENYCSINKPDPEKLVALMGAISCESASNPADKFARVFTGVANKYFIYNASDASVARLLIDAIACLFKDRDVYNRHDYFYGDNILYGDFSDRLDFTGVLKQCISWFFYEESSSVKTECYSMKEPVQQKNPGVLSELISALWREEKGDYDVVELARLVYKNDNDGDKQLCIIESLVLLEKQNTRKLPASVNLPLLIDDVIGFYLSRINDDPEEIRYFLFMVYDGEYSERCKECLVKKFRETSSSLINDWGRLTYSKELTDDEVAEHLNNIEIQLEYSLAMQLQIFSRDESNEVQEFIDVGESGLALEILMAIIFEETKEIASEALSLIQQLDGKMRMNTGIKHIEKYDGVPLGLKKLINDPLITKDASPDTEHVSYPCVHFMLSYQEKKLQDELKDSDLRLIQYDIAAVNDKASLLQSVSEALEFPDYFSHNWDALDECLVDMNDWMPAKGYVLVLSDAGNLWEHAKEAAETLISLWQKASQQTWRGENTPFHLVFMLSEKSPL